MIDEAGDVLRLEDALGPKNRLVRVQHPMVEGPGGVDRSVERSAGATE